MIVIQIMCINTAWGKKESPRTERLWSYIEDAKVSRDYKRIGRLLDSLIIIAEEDRMYDSMARALGGKVELLKFGSDVQQTLECLHQQRALLVKRNIRSDILTIAYSDLGQTYREAGTLDSALYYFGIARSRLPSTKGKLRRFAFVNTYNGLGKVHSSQGNLDSAAYYHLKQLDYINPTDTAYLYSTYFNLSDLFLSLNNYAEAQRYLDEGLGLVSQTDHRNNHAKALIKKASLEIALGNKSSAAEYAEKAIKFHDVGGLRKNAMIIYTIYAQTLLLNGSVAEARNAINKIEDPENGSDLELQTKYFLTLLEILIASTDIMGAKSAYQKATFFTNKLNQSSSKQRLYRVSAMYHSLLGNHKRAFEDQLAFTELKNQSVSERNIVVVNDLRTKYEATQNEKQIVQQQLQINKSKTNQTFLIGGMVVMALLGGLWIGLIRKENRTRSALKEAEINVLKRENKLIAMRSILSGQEEERKRIAQDLHDNIGTLMTTIKMKYIAIQRQVRGTSDSDDAAIVDDMLDQAASEIRRISYNMTPVAMDLTGLQGAVEDLESQLNLANIKSIFSIKDLSQVRDREKQVIVFRILQELVSNTCRHSRASVAKVSTSVENNVLYLSVSDNGQGMSLSEWERGEGMGVRNIQSRVQYLDGTVSMSSANGTHFEIEIPV